MTERLADLVRELAEVDRQERIELLIDLARSLPRLPERLEAHKDATHRVEECQSPVYLFVEVDHDRVELNADVPVEAPTVRGFVSLLVEGLQGASPAEVARVPEDLVRRTGLLEILGMQRVSGLDAVVRRLKRATAHAAAETST
jgi:cysteine desulfuration protein SufE